MSPVQPCVSTVENLLVRVSELSCHFAELIDREREQLSFLLRLHSELPLELLFVLNPIVKVICIIDKHAANDVNDTKEVARFYINVFDVGMSWKHESTIAMLHEVHASYIVSLKIDVVHWGYDFGLQEWADPSQE